MPSEPLAVDGVDEHDVFVRAQRLEEKLREEGRVADADDLGEQVAFIRSLMSSPESKSESVCGCSLETSTRKLHEQLVAIEDANPVAAAQVMAEMVCGAHNIEASDLALFAAQHNWRDPLATGEMFNWAHHAVAHVEDLRERR